MKGLFLDAVDDLADVFRRVVRADDPPVTVNEQQEVPPETLPAMLAGYDFVLDDHSQMPTEWMQRCTGLKHIIFLGTGARSYMHPEELAEHRHHRAHHQGLWRYCGRRAHHCADVGGSARVGVEWTAACGAASWIRTEGIELTGKTLGLLGFGGIAGEVARIAGGSGMRVLAWNRSPKSAPGVTFVDLDTLLAESDVLSVHLLLTDETRGFLSAERLAKLRPGAILVNTARGAIVDEAAMIAALRSGHLRHAALDVFNEEPLEAGHELSTLPNVTLSAHSAFRTPEASREPDPACVGYSEADCRRVGPLPQPPPARGGGDFCSSFPPALLHSLLLVRLFNHSRAATSLPLHLHDAFHRHHVVVHVIHDPQRSDDQQEHDQHAERQRQHVVGVVRPGGDVQEEDQVNAHLRDRQHDQRDRDAGLPDERRAAK